MAIVARMQATEVVQRGGGQWVPCECDDSSGEAHLTEEIFRTHHYGTPAWLRGAKWVRRDMNAQGSESIRLTAVSAKDQEDPNRDWAEASPSGELTLTINNPGAFDYVTAGGVYRVTIEKIRPPRNLTFTGSGVGWDLNGKTPTLTTSAES